MTLNVILGIPNSTIEWKLLIQRYQHTYVWHFDIKSLLVKMQQYTVYNYRIIQNSHLVSVHRCRIILF